MMRKKRRKTRPPKPFEARRAKKGRRRKAFILRCPGCGAKARFLKREEIIKVGPVRYWFRWAKCPRCTKAFLVKHSP